MENGNGFVAERPVIRYRKKHSGSITGHFGTDQQKIDIYILDSLVRVVQKSFTFNNEAEDEKGGYRGMIYARIYPEKKSSDNAGVEKLNENLLYSPYRKWETGKCGFVSVLLFLVPFFKPPGCIVACTLSNVGSWAIVEKSSLSAVSHNHSDRTCAFSVLRSFEFSYFTRLAG